MCLIIVKAKDKVLEEKTLRSAHEKNKDGWGMMRLNSDGNVYVEKGITNFKKFKEIYDKRFANYECAIHFRKATCGKVNKEQAHPYEITKDAWLMHNGHIYGFLQYEKEKSDSWHFAQYIKSTVEKNWLTDQDYVSILEAALWNGNNKVVILTKTDGFIILNKELGREYKECWYSNTYAWELPDDLKQEIQREEYEKLKRNNTAPYYLSSGIEYEKEKKFINSVLINMFAEKIHKGEISESFIEFESADFKNEVLLKCLSLDDKSYESEIPKEFRVFDKNITEEYEDALEVIEVESELSTDIPEEPIILQDVLGKTMEELKEIAYHHPEAMASLVFDAVHS